MVKKNNFVLLFEKIDSTKAYSVEEAVALAKETNSLQNSDVQL